MATGADHGTCVGYPSFEGLLVHIATLAEDAGEPRSITYGWCVSHGLEPFVRQGRQFDVNGIPGSHRATNGSHTHDTGESHKLAV